MRAPAHIGQGSKVTTRVTSDSRHVPSALAASDSASISACAVGSRRGSRSLWRAAMGRPPWRATAPTGTSSWAMAATASSRASPIAASSSSGSSPVARAGDAGCEEAASVPMAETVGFEPTVSFPTHDFQSCRFGRSRTSPTPRADQEFTPGRPRPRQATPALCARPPGPGAAARPAGAGKGPPAPAAPGAHPGVTSLVSPVLGATAGSCATSSCESSQGRKAAALSGSGRVPQPIWPSHRAPGGSVLAGRPARSSGGGGSRGPVGSSDVADAPDDVPYQSLYRRFRPSTFGEVRGQDHVVLALRNAVRDGRVAHAYLFSGPRGTGKTSTARILAKALNCTDLQDGEPCGVCPSCVEITRGTSLDVHELDAASNNGVDAMRDLVSRAALGSPGRQKVYIVDEVHMLSTPASNALLKTLEEPPAHVVFVLATTDPQKVLPTIRSRTQHFEFRLLGPETLGELLAQVRQDAHLDVPDEALDLAVRRGRGSARDALSVLDQVAASDAVD